MASFESKVSKIFDEHPKLARKIPIVIKKMFRETEVEFGRRIGKYDEDDIPTELIQLYDVLFIDFYFTELHNNFLGWVVENYPEQFTPDELEEMRAEAASHLDVYEVQDVIPGKGSYLKSLIKEKTFFLKDISFSYQLVKWDIIIARCFYFRGEYYATGTTIVLDQRYKKFILEKIEDYMMQYGYDDYDKFAKDHWEIFFQIEHDVQKKAEQVKFFTKYGEFKPCEVRFKVKNLNSVLKEIKNRNEFLFAQTKQRRDSRTKRRILRYEFDWTTDGIEKEIEHLEVKEQSNGLLLDTKILDESGKETNVELLGRLYVDQFLCRLETKCSELADFAVGYFKQIFGDALTYQRTNLMNMDAIKEAHRQSDAEKMQPKEEIPPELAEKFLEKYYLNLLNEPIPALKNKTPIQASTDPELKPLLIEWLKGLENLQARSQGNPEQAKKLVNKLKKRLGIDF